MPPTSTPKKISGAIDFFGAAFFRLERFRFFGF
jgi:hypothetical protein